MDKQEYLGHLQTKGVQLFASPISCAAAWIEGTSLLKALLISRLRCRNTPQLSNDILFSQLYDFHLSLLSPASNPWDSIEME